MLEAVEESFDDMFGSLLGIDWTSHIIDQPKILNCQCWWWCFIEFCDLVQNFNRFSLFASTDQKLWRFIKVENKVSKKKDCQSHTSEDDDLVSPSHIAGHSATILAGFDTVACRKCRSASVLCGGAISDTGSGNDADRLPHRQKGDEEPAILWKEFKRDGCINGNVASQTN